MRRGPTCECFEVPPARELGLVTDVAGRCQHRVKPTTGRLHHRSIIRYVHRPHSTASSSITVVGGQEHFGRPRPGADRRVRGVRGAYPFRAEFCAPAKGGETGSVETGVKYVRNLVFRPRLAVENWTALNAAIIAELEADLPRRDLDDGRSVEDALTLERQHLRAMAAHRFAHLRRRCAGGRQVRTRPGGQGDLLGADPPRLPAGVGEAVSRPDGGRRRRGGGGAARPGVLPRHEGPRCVSRAAVTRA